MTTLAGDDTELREVHLLQLPVDLQLDASQWHEDLMREFALIDLGGEDAGGTTVPARLLSLVSELRARYEQFSTPAREQLAAAREQGRDTTDVTYRVPPEVADAAERFNDLLEEADAFCRRGDLLTLAAPTEYAAFRRWFLQEFVVQLRGGPATPWPRHAEPGAPGTSP